MNNILSAEYDLRLILYSVVPDIKGLADENKHGYRAEILLLPLNCIFCPALLGSKKVPSYN
jgi:hypothetical protein